MRPGLNLEGQAKNNDEELIAAVQKRKSEGDSNPDDLSTEMWTDLYAPKRV